MSDDEMITLEIIGDKRYRVMREWSVVTLFITRETSTKNMLWIRALSIGIRWPPIIWINCFTEVKE